MKSVFYQMAGRKKEGNPPHNNIRCLEVDTTTARFLCESIPGDINIIGHFRMAGLHLQIEEDVGPTIVIPRSELPMAIETLLSSFNSIYQRDFLNRLKKIEPHL